ALDLSAWKGCERLATQEGAVVLQSAKLFGTLKAALAGTGRSVAFSGRQGHNFREPTLSLRHLAQSHTVQSRALNGGCDSLALVFGSEDVGLSTEAVLVCTDDQRSSSFD
ncbi:unnamed protein product, partial [Effrenium voratum]